MQDARKRTRRRRSCRKGPEPKLAGIDCKPAPDAQDRLRRIYTILLRHATKDGQSGTPP